MTFQNQYSGTVSDILKACQDYDKAWDKMSDEEMENFDAIQKNKKLDAILSRLLGNLERFIDNDDKDEWEFKLQDDSVIMLEDLLDEECNYNRDISQNDIINDICQLGMLEIGESFITNNGFMFTRIHNFG